MIKILRNDSVNMKAMNVLLSYKNYSKTYNFLKETQKWDKDKLNDFQLKKLKNLIEFSYLNVPYYTRLFDEINFRPNEIEDLNDIDKIPFLTKELIRENIGLLRANNLPDKKFEYVTTGGSSGVPLGFYYEKGTSRAIEWAFIKTLWDRVGYKFRDKSIVLKGNVISSTENGRYWEKALFGRTLILSSYHMSEENLSQYIKLISKFKPKYIQAYPSTITILARFMMLNNIPPFEDINAIFCSSENMYSEQRQLLEDFFDCRIFTWYGHSERAVLAGACENSDDYHIFPEYGIFELVTKNGKKIKNSNTEGTIVGTGLTNYAMPLIRYKTDDKASFSGKSCKCGRNYRSIKNVKGRWKQEFIINRNRMIPITALNMHSNIFDRVEKFQFMQEKVDEIIFNIVKSKEYSEKDTINIKKELKSKIGNDMNIVIQFVDDISRTPRGKYNFIIQKLDILE